MTQTAESIFQETCDSNSFKYVPERPNKSLFFHRAQFKSGTNLSRGSRRGGGGGAGAVLQGEVSDEDNELGKCTTDLSARALKQVLREPVRVRKQNVVCKPIAYILTVSQQDAEGVIPRGESKENIYRDG